MILDVGSIYKRNFIFHNSNNLLDIKFLKLQMQKITPSNIQKLKMGKKLWNMIEKLEKVEYVRYMPCSYIKSLNTMRVWFLPN